MQLDEIVPWGRTFKEYKLMFNLSESDLNANILGCGDGPASFNAEMTSQNYSVISIDPIYLFSAQQIRQRVQETYKTIISQVRQNSDQYIWKNFRDVDELGASRLSAMERFLADYDVGKAEARYLPQSLPSLDLADNQFDLCLCSHLLFLYSAQLSLEFHVEAIHELLRVSKEVRIFPLLRLDGELSSYVKPVIQKMSQQGISTKIQSVAYEFQKGGNQMLHIQR
ncbi:SAM-dependent methyltransferase [Leptolyngbya cf. ectocarpi LEGE 11479]|uniref:SAM-dependent methyltransferase n=2 Tax=Leptolyngbya ectocarpi TaxID=1202 RepID=A0A928ZZ18_LEPEC|nr:SAM-dependent methyltransferase [Leptolyngbya cf. ectocarpi LEGE 11479]